MAYPVTRLIIIGFLLVYALFLLSLFDSERLFKGRAALTFLAGAVMFLFVYFVQMPIQKFISTSGYISGANYVLGVIVLSLVAGFLQEIFKIIPAVLSEKGDIFIGAVSGAGFGFIEAMIMIVPARQFVITEIIEWLVVIAFQMALTALFSYGIQKQEFIKYYVFVSLIHSVFEFFIIMGRMKPTLLLAVDIVILVATVPLFVISVKKYIQTKIG